jgi:hypothetical protein
VTRTERVRAAGASWLAVRCEVDGSDETSATSQLHGSTLPDGAATAANGPSRRSTAAEKEQGDIVIQEQQQQCVHTDMNPREDQALQHLASGTETKLHSARAWHATLQRRPMQQLRHQAMKAAGHEIEAMNIERYSATHLQQMMTDNLHRGRSVAVSNNGRNIERN